MKISIWNIYNRLSYPDRIPLIKDGSPSIETVRWIISKDLSPETIYIGSEGEFFASSQGNTLIVNRNDMILIHNADPEEVFNDVSSIIEMHQKWDADLAACTSFPNALDRMLDISSSIFTNPCFIYAPDGKALALPSCFPPETHWHWAQLMEHHGLTPEMIGEIQELDNLTNVFLDREPTFHTSPISNYIHCSLVIHGYMAGHFVLFDMLHPIEIGTGYLVENLLVHVEKYMRLHYEDYNPTSRIGEFISALIHGRPYVEREFQLLQKALGWNSPEDIYQLCVFKENVKGEPVMLSSLHRKLSSSLRNSVLMRENNLLILLINRTRNPSEFKSFMHAISSEPRFFCGISNTFQNLQKIGIYYRQALSELVYCKEHQLARSSAADHTSVHLENLMEQDPVNAAYVRRELVILKNYDRSNHTQYYQTIKAWFYSSFHPTAAAAMLNIHRNSFNYRMARMREIICFDEMDQISLSRDYSKMNEFFYSFIFLDHRPDKKDL